jgi:hypothetical protein
VISKVGCFTDDTLMKLDVNLDEILIKPEPVL